MKTVEDVQWRKLNTNVPKNGTRQGKNVQSISFSKLLNCDLFFIAVNKWKLNAQVPLLRAVCCVVSIFLSDGFLLMACGGGDKWNY